jgi:nitrite reductase/ring-hydroxylating ferredoxin subunit/uncharacterized membrane protein
MANPPIIAAIEQQEWLEPVDKALATVAENALPGETPVQQGVKNFLHGTWLGHPLHPVLTDVPLGFWSATAALDLIDMASGKEEYSGAADTALAIGLAGAMGAAVTGLNDWQHTDGGARRVGVMHGLLNVGAAVLYTASLLLRRRGARPAGRTVGLAGYALSFASAYLGGHLVYGQQVGVDHTAGESAPAEWVAVLPEAELGEGTPRRAEAAGTAVLLVRCGERIHALADTCAHLGCSLSEGEVKEGSIVCPCHGSRYALEDGRVLNGPSTFPQPCFAARVRDGQVEIRGGA